MDRIFIDLDRRIGSIDPNVFGGFAVTERMLDLFRPGAKHK